MSDDQSFLDAIERFGQEFLVQHPDLSQKIDQARAGTIDPKEIVKEVWSLAAKNQTFQDSVEKALFEAFQIDPGSTDLEHFPDRQKMLDRWGFSDDDLLYQPFEDRPNYKMLHPLLMGMIVELIQYDGDVPELRTGILPEGGTPAVPVKTLSRDPVVLGAMLRRASEEVAFELGSVQKEQDAKVARMLTTLPEENDAVTGLVRRETERGVAIEGYAPGKKAQMREVQPPSTTDLVRMPFQERQELAHKAITSTQGRRSAVPVIAQMVLFSLQQEHAQVQLGNKTEFDNARGTDKVFIEVEWGMQIEGGQNERNPNFNFIDTAARSLTTKLRGILTDEASRHTKHFLVVFPLNTISERRVGWRAALYSL